MKLVEIIAALQTSPEVVERASQFARAMGKELTVSKDTPGFISNRLLMVRLSFISAELTAPPALHQRSDHCPRVWNRDQRGY